MKTASAAVMLALISASVSGCDENSGSTDKGTTAKECGARGELHDDHCDCDEGYATPDDDPTTCVADDDRALDDMQADRDDVPEGRLLVANGEAGRVVVVDLAEAETLVSLEVQGPARLYAGTDGATGYAVQSSEDVVQGIDSGLSYTDHGDHLDLEKDAPSVMSDVLVDCSRPVHFVLHDGWAAAFCDGDGMLHVFEEGDATEEVASIDSGRPHHGVGLVAFEHVLLSSPNEDDEEDSLPVGVRVLDLQGREVAAFDGCPGLHGEAAMGGDVLRAFAAGAVAGNGVVDELGIGEVQLRHDALELFERRLAHQWRH